MPRRRIHRELGETNGMGEGRKVRDVTSDGRIEQVTTMVVLAILAIGCFVVLRPFLSPILWAVILSFSTWPIYTRVKNLLGGRRTAAALVMVIVAALLLVAPVVIVGSSLADNVASLASAIRRVLAEGLPMPPTWVADLPFVGHGISDRWQGLANDGAGLTAELQPYIGTVGNWILSLGASVGSGIVELLLSLLIAFFLYRDGVTAAAKLEAITGRLAGDRAQNLLETAAGTIKGVVYGILGTNLVQGVLSGFGFWLSGVPGAFLLGFLAFFLTTIPGGPVIIWVPAVAWLFHNAENGWGIFLAVWSLAVFGPLENILRPYLISRGSDLPLILVLLGMIGGLIAFGLLGIFLGPVLLAIGGTLVGEWSMPDPDRRDASAVSPNLDAPRRVEP